MAWSTNGRRPHTDIPALRLLVADHQPMVRAALAALLAADGHHVVAEANDSYGVRTAMRLWDFDVALIDLDLTSDAIALIGTLRGKGVPTIILAASADHPQLCAALDSGAAGLALKTESVDLLRLCLAAVAAGERWIDTRASVQALGQSQMQKDAQHLTRRERDVARLVATGQRNRAIAGALGISEGTVKMHLHNVFAKLGLESRTQLAVEMRAS